MRYVEAEIEKEDRTEAYRIYVTDCLYYQGQNMALQERWIDLIDRPRQPVKTPEEVLYDTIAKGGLTVV